ncbi:hypothetical protein ATN89_12815 [Comamonas thiooxydans]|nr:hypothetical protein ATN89_12815 [Comamonas thiooxydans]
MDESLCGVAGAATSSNRTRNRPKIVAAEPPMAGPDLPMRIRIHAAGTTLLDHAMHGLYFCRDGLAI